MKIMKYFLSAALFVSACSPILAIENELSEAQIEAIESALEKPENSCFKGWKSAALGWASMPLFIASGLTNDPKYFLAGYGLIASGLTWFELDRNSDSSYSTYAKITLANALRAIPASVMGLMISPISTGLGAVGLVEDEIKGNTGISHNPAILGMKASAAALIPLLAQRLLENTGSQLANGTILAAAALASYSGIKDLIAYNRSKVKTFTAFLYQKELLEKCNQE